MTLTQYVRNGWYLGAWSDEIGRTLTQRWITDIPVCFYRLPDQTVTAVEDRCPHRKYPLSLGHLNDEGTLQCDYHGYRFDGQGVCVGVAEQADRPKAALRRFPLVERDGAIWIWPGDPDLADESLLPDTSWLTDPGWTHVHGVVPLKARHMLLLENLLDLTHETFLHPTTIGNAAVAATPIDVTVDGDRVSFSRHMIGIEAPPFYEKSCGLTSPVDRWQDGDFYPPGIFILNIRVAATGTEEPEGFHMKVLYGLTAGARQRDARLLRPGPRLPHRRPGAHEVPARAAARRHAGGRLRPGGAGGHVRHRPWRQGRVQHQVRLGRPPRTSRGGEDARPRAA